MFWNMLLISLALLTIAMVGMMLNILVKKKGKFPAYQVGHNKDMARKGIKCVRHEEIRCHRAMMKEKDTSAACESCSQPV